MLLKETLTQVFSYEFCEIFKNTFFDITPLVAASESRSLPADPMTSQRRRKKVLILVSKTL